MLVFFLWLPAVSRKKRDPGHPDSTRNPVQLQELGAFDGDGRAFAVRRRSRSVTQFQTVTIIIWFDERRYD